MIADTVGNNLSDWQPLSGRRLLVTGAASGIGRSIAELAAACGATVIAADLNHEAARALAVTLTGDRPHLALPIDVADEGSVAEAFGQLEAALGGVDAVIHCAGIWLTKSDRDAPRTALATWQRTIDVNLTGTFLVCRAAVPMLESQGGGSIVNVASVVALTGWTNLAAYSASKGGVVAFTRALAMDCAAKNIRVNCLCPGVCETEMTRQVLKYAPPQRLPIGRLGTPEEIARTAIFLISDWASFSLGSTVVVDGGFTAS